MSKFNETESVNLLNKYLEEIQEGDTTNREGHAAKVYFNALFGQEFSRRDNSIEINNILNYTYAILLASIAREIVAAGFICQLGLWHKGEFNSNNLASDLMEPFRPLIDEFVLHSQKDTDFKEKVKLIIGKRIKIANQYYFWDNAISVYVRSVLKFMSNESEEIAEINSFIID